MEYWLRRGDAEYSFDAPEEAIVYEVQPNLKPAEDINEKLAKIRTLIDGGVTIIDFMHPLDSYIAILENINPQDTLLLLTGWRLGDEEKEIKIVQEIKNRLPSIALHPLSQIKKSAGELRDRLIEFIKIEGKVTYLYPMTPLTELVLPMLDNVSSRFLSGLGKTSQEVSLEAHFIGIAQDPKGPLLDVSFEKVGCHSTYTVELSNQFDCVVVSPGGSPFDDTLYQSIQSLYGVYQSVKKGGTIILAAECIEGVGSRELIRMLSAKKKNEANQNPMNSAYTSFENVLLDFLDRVKDKSRIYLVSPIPRTIAQRFLDIRVFDTLQDAVQQAVRLHTRSLSICVVPHGHFTRLVVGREASPEEQQT